MRLFAYALLGALALCDSAWCVEEQSATDRYARAVHDAEQQYGPTDATLVAPLSGLADALVAAGQPTNAIDALTRAVNILRRSGGLYDTRQYSLLNQLTDLHSLQGDIDAAVAALAYMERVSERAHGRQSTLHANTLAAIAAWHCRHCRLGRFDSGRERFRRSIERLRTADQEALIVALLGLARCSFDELAAEGVATSPDSLDAYRGPVLRRNRMSIGSPAFHYRVLKILRSDGEQALRHAAQLAETAEDPLAAPVQGAVSGADARTAQRPRARILRSATLRGDRIHGARRWTHRPRARADARTRQVRSRRNVAGGAGCAISPTHGGGRCARDRRHALSASVQVNAE